jgi:class 3 adenylate cyclase
MLSTLVGGVLNNAIDFEISVELTEQQLREKKKLTSLFSKYVSPSIVENIINSNQTVNLGGIETEIAILFVDIRGFTTMSENMSPTRIVSLLNEYFHEMNEIIFHHDGTLDKYMGDAIMALFGAPVKKGDDCLRAVKCALDMMKKLDEMNEEWKKEDKQNLSIGIGINYGTVVVGNIGSEHRYEYTAIGDNVNVASRLCSIAKPGQILISDNVFMEVFDSIDINQLEPIKVKGRAEPVKVYEVTNCIV